MDIACAIMRWTKSLKGKVMRKYLHEHYHWVIALVALLSYTVFGGLMNNISSLYLVPVSQSLGVSRTSVSLTSSLRSVCNFCVNMVFGLIYSKFGFRKLCTAGLAICGLAFCGLGSAQSVISYGFFCAMIGIVDTFCNTAALSKLTNEWFISHRGLVLGIVTASSGFGGSLFSMLLSGIMERQGWRRAHTVSGIILLVTALMVFLLIRSSPHDMGLRPFYDGSQKKSTKKKSLIPREEGLPFEQLKKKPVFYLTLLSCFLSACVAYAPFYILVAHLTDNGLGQNQVAQIWSILFLLMALAKILDGFFCDLVGAKIVVSVSTISCGLACLLFANTRTFAGAMIPTVLLAIGLPLTSILPPLSVGAVLGMKSYDHTVGLAMATAAVASLSTNPIMNALYGALGSYETPLRCLFLLAILSVLLHLLVCRLARRQTENCAAEEE